MRRIIAFVLFFGITNISIMAKTNTGNVLVPDPVGKGLLNQRSITQENGYILVKQNPTQLNEGELTFVTTKDGVVTAAEPEDLLKADALKKVLVGQFTQLGTLRIFTLANLGYLKIHTVEKPQVGTEFYFLTTKGNLVGIRSVEFKDHLPKLRSMEELKGKTSGSNKPQVELPPKTQANPES